MCSRVVVVGKFAALIIVMDEMMETAGFSETSVNFCPIRGVTSHKRECCHICNFVLQRSAFTRDEIRGSLLYDSR